MVHVYFIRFPEVHDIKICDAYVIVDYVYSEYVCWASLKKDGGHESAKEWVKELTGMFMD